MKSSVRYRKYSQFYQRDTKIRMKVSQNDSKKSCLQPTASRSFTVYVLRPSTTTCNYEFNTFFLMMVNVLQAQASYSAIKKQVKYISLMIYCPPFLNYFPCKGWNVIYRVCLKQEYTPVSYRSSLLLMNLFVIR